MQSNNFSFKRLLESMPQSIYDLEDKLPEHFQVYDVILTFFADRGAVEDVLDNVTSFIFFTKDGYEVYPGVDNYNELKKIGVCVWIPFLGDSDIIAVIVEFLKLTLIAFQEYSDLL